ncbi:MAG: hypothetical protein LUG84_02215 [Akkermansiaceae bacterium]|nr:hypothetical protein [Akkermansiaceae bacterium]
MPSPVTRTGDSPYRQMELNPRLADNERHSPANVNLQVEAAQRQIEDLEQRRRELDAQKKELEKINEQKSEFTEQLNRVGLRLHNSVRRMEKELESIRQEQEDIIQTCKCFKMHIQILSALNPQNWSHEGLHERLIDALPKIERAENDYNEAYSHGAHFRHTSIFRKKREGRFSSMQSGGIGEQFIQGLAFHLPLACLLLLAWGVYSIFH